MSFRAACERGERGKKKGGGQGGDSEEGRGQATAALFFCSGPASRTGARQEREQVCPTLLFVCWSFMPHHRRCHLPSAGEAIAPLSALSGVTARLKKQKQPAHVPCYPSDPKGLFLFPSRINTEILSDSFSASQAPPRLSPTQLISDTPCSPVAPPPPKADPLG